MLSYQPHSIQEYINKQLFSHEHKRVREMIEKIIVQSDVLMARREGAPFEGFIFNGTHYRSKKTSIRDKRLPALPLQLIDEMEKIQEDSLKLLLDRQRIGQAHMHLLLVSDTDQDVRNNLSDMVIPLLPENFQHMQRTAPEAEGIKHDERKYRQYMHIRERIEFYSATRLFY